MMASLFLVVGACTVKPEAAYVALTPCWSRTLASNIVVHAVGTYALLQWMLREIECNDFLFGVLLFRWSTAALVTFLTFIQNAHVKKRFGEISK